MNYLAHNVLKISGVVSTIFSQFLTSKVFDRNVLQLLLKGKYFTVSLIETSILGSASSFK